MNYFKQIYYEMRHHKMMTWVSISGTALAIFLVMTFIMADGIGRVEIAPESKRSRIMNGINAHVIGIESPTDMGSNGLNANFAKKLYSDLDGIEMVSFVNAGGATEKVGFNGVPTVKCSGRGVDDNFWEMFDFRFIDGRPFDAAECEATANVVVVSRSLARSLFAEDKVAGREIEIEGIPHTIVGVVEDVSPLFSNTFADMFTVFNVDRQKWPEWNNWIGHTGAYLLRKEGVSPEAIKEQVKARYAQIAPEAAKDDYNVIYHLQPYTADDMQSLNGVQNDPDTEQRRRRQWSIYALLILLPAINLSSMTRSRLRHRVAEIGVRRAFGAKRTDIITQLMGENFIITLIGGAIGLVLSVVFILLFSNLLFNYHISANSLKVIDVRPEFEMLFRWSNFFIALGGCFLLNMLSATVPAWKSSLIMPAEALSTH